MASIQVDENEFCPLRWCCRSHCSALLPLVTHPESSKNLKQQHQEILATLVVVQRWLLKRFLREHCLHWTVLVNLKYASDIKTRKCKFLFFFLLRERFLLYTLTYLTYLSVLLAALNGAFPGEWTSCHQCTLALWLSHHCTTYQRKCHSQTDHSAKSKRSWGLWPEGEPKELT